MPPTSPTIRPMTNLLTGSPDFFLKRQINARGLLLNLTGLFSYASCMTNITRRGCAISVSFSERQCLVIADNCQKSRHAGGGYPLIIWLAHSISTSSPRMQRDEYPQKTKEFQPGWNCHDGVSEHGPFHESVRNSCYHPASTIARSHIDGNCIYTYPDPHPHDHSHRDYAYSNSLDSSHKHHSSHSESDRHSDTAPNSHTQFHPGIQSRCSSAHTCALLCSRHLPAGRESFGSHRWGHVESAARRARC